MRYLKPHHAQLRHTKAEQVIRSRITITTQLLVAVLVGVGSGISGIPGLPSVHAAQLRQTTTQSPTEPTIITESTKVTLPETSIAGPAYAGKAIAWTGTDVEHHINISLSSDGVHFTTKTVLPETSPYAPAIAPVVGIKTTLSYAIAWAGSDTKHSLNVQIIPGGKKLTLPETSFAAPALDIGYDNGATLLLLAWTGTDANHSLNVLPLTTVDAVTVTPGSKTTLPEFSSDAGPTLLANIYSKHDVWVLGWTTRTTQQLNLATAADGVHFTGALGTGLPETSATAPTLLSPSGSDSCISWTGADPAHHLNVQCTTYAQFPQFPDPARTKTVLPETALGTQGGAFGGNGPDSGLIAWTGTDPAHHLNVAVLQGL